MGLGNIFPHKEKTDTEEENQQIIFEMIDLNKLPRHIAIVMDGNGRWASQHKLPRFLGHRQGTIALRGIIEACVEMNIEFLSIFAFSKENWKRPADEINSLMSLLIEFLDKELAEMHRQNIQIRVVGDMTGLAPAVRQSLTNSVETTAYNYGLVLNVVLNYSSRWEITEAVKKIAYQVAEGTLKPEDITKKTVEENLATANQPDPDLLIRTSGELRLSNFLLWQMAYTELYFTKVYWPDFSKKDLYEAIYEYQCRERRYGGIISNI